MLAALLPAALFCLPAHAQRIGVFVAGSEVPGLGFAVPEGSEWCLHWRHSVTGGAVTDCFRTDRGRMVLDRSFLHDFAAGLGHVPGRGRQVAAPDGGYWIEDIDEPLPEAGLVLRVGTQEVGHRIVTPDGAEIDLSAVLAGSRVRLRLKPAAERP